MSKKDDLNYNYRIVGIMDKYKRAIGNEFGLSEHDFETIATEIEKLFEQQKCVYCGKFMSGIGVNLCHDDCREEHEHCP